MSQHLNEYQVKQIALPSVGNLIQSNRDLNRIKKLSKRELLLPDCFELTLTFFPVFGLELKY